MVTIRQRKQPNERNLREWKNKLNFLLDPQGRICNEGPYQGEMLYVAYFHQLYLEKELDMQYADGTIEFIITDIDREAFPTLGEAERIYIFERKDSKVETYVEGILA